MSEAYKSALLVGASGLIGQKMSNFLLESPAYHHVKVFVRKQLIVEHPKLEQIVVDFDQLQKYQRHMNVNDVYCCLGTTIKKAGTQTAFRRVDYDYPLTLCKLAKENGAEKFLVVTALGANANSKIFYNRIKGEVEEALKKTGIPSLHIFQPSLLLGERAEFRFGEKIAVWLSPLISLLLVGGLRKYRPISARDVALAMYSVGQKQLSGTFIYQSNQIEDLSRKYPI